MVKKVSPKKEYRIELKISALHQLFNSMDPSPFHERDLDRDAEEFIVSWARECPKDEEIRLVVHLAQAPAGVVGPEAMIEESTRHYFSYRAGLAMLELKQLMKEGRASLAIGLLFLGACSVLARLFQPVAGTWHGVVHEGLVIMGWVAMWHPLEIHLYRWWPLLHLKRLYEELARAGVSVRIA